MKPDDSTDKTDNNQDAESREKEFDFDDLADQFAKDCRLGTAQPIESYAALYPKHAQQIRELFPSIEAIEKLGSDVSKANRNEQAQAAIAFNRIEQIGDYKIVGQIGRGGMGIVYDAIQMSLGRPVAVKLLLQQSSDAKHLNRFQREAKTAANLHHTNIVPVFGVGSQDGYHYYAMQRIDGVGLDEVIAKLKDPNVALDSDRDDLADRSDLADRASLVDRVVAALNDGAFLPPSEHGSEPNYFRSVAWIVKQIANALEYAHEQGTLHRDVKPANLLLDTEGGVWVADFGLAKAMENDNVSRTGDVVGTLRYMAPEQFTGNPSPHSDTYSLGLTLYEMLTLTPAHDDTSRSHLVASSPKGHRITPPRQHDDKIPNDLATIAMKASATDIRSRYTSAGELAADLENFLNDRPIMARPANMAERLGKWCRRNPAVASLVGLAALLLATVAVTTSVGYVRINAALNRELEQRIQIEAEKQKANRALSKAETTLGISLEALDRVYRRFAPDRMLESNTISIEGVDGEEISVPTAPALSRETAALLEDVLGFYDQFAQQDSDNRELQVQAAKANRRVGDIHRQLGAYENAESAYKNSAARFGKIADVDIEDSIAIRLELARIQNDLGDVYLAWKGPNDARKAHATALDILEPLLVAESRHSDATLELARTLYLLDKRKPPEPGQGPPRNGPRPNGSPPRGSPPRKGDPNDAGPPPRFDPSHSPPPRNGPPTGEPPQQRRRGRPPHPPERFENLDRAIKLLEGMNFDQSGYPEHRFLLALCYRERVRRGRADESAPAIQILQQLSGQYPQVADYRFELAETYGRFDVRHLRNSELDDAINRLRTGLVYAEQLATQHPNIPRYAQAHSDTLLKLGTLLEKFSRLDPEKETAVLNESEDCLREAIKIQAELKNQFPETISHRLRHAQAMEALAKTLRSKGKFPEAINAIHESIASLEKLIDEQPKVDFLPHSLIRHYHTLARIHDGRNDKQAAKEARDTAAELRNKMPRPKLFGF
jgi:serine/threonine protein kinase